MKRAISPLTAFYLGLVSAFLSLSTLAHAQSVHGTFRVVKGDVKVLRASDNQEVVAKIGQKVLPKDTIVAGKDSRAKIVMIDNNEINVSPDSRVQIQNYEYKPTEEKKNVLLNVIYGKVRAKVNQKYDGENKFQVKTPSAVAGVRGTDFFTSYDRGTGATQVVTFEGRVAFGQPGANGQIRNAVMVSVGQTTSIVGNAPPAPPVAMPKTELSQMEQQSDAGAPDISGDSRAPAESSGGVQKDEGEGTKSGDGAKTEGASAGSLDGSTASTEATTDSSRAPASTAGPGSTLLAGDLAGSPNPSVPPVLPSLGGLPIGPVLPPTTLLPIRNDFIGETIGSSNRKLLINVQTPSGP